MLRVLSSLYELFESSAINTIAKLPKAIKMQQHDNALLRGINFYINKHAIDANSSATSVAIDR
jgi:hypothetical protein